MVTQASASNRETLSVPLPFGWLQIDARADRAEEVDRVSRELAGDSPRDSAPVVRKRFEARLTALLESIGAEDGFSIHSLLFPVGRSIGVTLPVSVAVGSVRPPAAETRLTPNEILVGMALAYPGSVPVPVDDTVALRMSSVQPAGASVAEVAADLAGADGHTSASTPPEVSEVQSLRVRYLFGWQDPTPSWYLVIASALVPGGDDAHKLTEEYFGLFDLLVAAIRRVPGTGA
jgi:hypothetical protein